MEKIKVTYAHDQTVAYITLDDGKGNVLDHIMMEEIQQQLDSWKTNNDLKLIVFQGAGKHFSFGASVEEHQKEYAGAMLRAFHQLFYSLRELAIPTLAKVSGQCLGGGMELALMCNIMLADKTAKFGQPEILLGVFPPPASILLPEKIGLARAEELLITGRSMPADEAFRAGLLAVVFEDRGELDAGTEEWIGSHILSKSASSLRYAVRAVRVKFNHVIGNFLPALENMYVTRLMETHDANEGISSFLEKRKPNWSNN